jgi:hypothetical protein
MCKAAPQEAASVEAKSRFAQFRRLIFDFLEPGSDGPKHAPPISIGEKLRGGGSISASHVAVQGGHGLAKDIRTTRRAHAV